VTRRVVTTRDPYVGGLEGRGPLDPPQPPECSGCGAMTDDCPECAVVADESAASDAGLWKDAA